MDPLLARFLDHLRGTPAYWAMVIVSPPRMGVEDWTCGSWHGSEAANDERYSGA